MPARVFLDGLDELRADLRAMPAELAVEAGPIVLEAAERAKASMHYPRITGDLQDHVKVETVSGGRFGAAAKVTQGSRLGYIFEHGTVARHYFTRSGAKHLTGRMPPGHVFVPAVIQARRQMYDELKAFVAEKGFQVSGG